MITDDFYKVSYHTIKEEMTRKDQVHIFFLFFFDLRGLIRQYEIAPSVKLFKQLQALKEEVADFVFQESFSLDVDIYDGLLQLQDYVINYLTHKEWVHAEEEFD